MPLVMNASSETQTTKAYGQWFTFKPGQIKMMEDRFAHFLTGTRHYLGFVGLSERFSDPDYKQTQEGRKEYEDTKEKGVRNRIEHLKSIVRNNLDSLRQDLRMANIDSDPRAFMSDGEMYALEQLSEYEKAGEDKKAKRVEKAKDLMKELGLKED